LSVTEPIELTLLNEENIKDNKLPIQKEAWFGSIIDARNKSSSGVGAIAKLLKLNFETISSRVDAWPSGLISIIYANRQQRYTVLTSVVPISENEIKLHAFVMINKTGNFLLDFLSYIIFGFVNQAIGMKDKPIFDNMADSGRAFVNTDRPVLKFREFYQSWVNKAH
jgi:hypothetical protein